MTRPRFHLAFGVHDLAAARAFYGGILGCPEGRSSDDWVDFDLYGHQIVAHLVTRGSTGGQRAEIPADRDTPADGDTPVDGHGSVDGHEVPVPHFGLLLSPDDWHELAERLRDAGVRFEIEPHTRFAGQVGEQSTMFFHDPSGNALEFKAFADDSLIFER